jgi:hypothetical protein
MTKQLLRMATAKAAARQRHTSLEASPWQFEAMDHRRPQLRWQHPISGDNQIATFDSSLDIVLINARERHED